MLSLLLLALCGMNHALACPSKPRFKADIRADTNRDGRVDLPGLSDTIDKTQWNETYGAIFLPNIGDTDQRCSKLAYKFEALYDTHVSSKSLDNCHDASDNTQRSPKYLAPLKTVPILTLAENAIGTVTVADAIQRKLVRIFQKQGKGWVYVDNNHIFSQRELQAGLELGIDARNTRRPKTRDPEGPHFWDGRVTVRFTVHVGDTKSSDTVMLRVAPVLTHHHLQKIEQVLAAHNIRDPYLADFTENLASIAKAAGMTKDLHLFETYDKWVQDFVEPGYASMPGPNGTVSIRIMILCPRTMRDGGQLIFLSFRKAGVGAVQHLGISCPATNAGGNTETIPPYTFKGKAWPAGRLVVGRDGSEHPDILSYLETQESQKPLRLDTSWLAVGHVDEFLQFIPANNSRGWVAVISDPRLAIKLLEYEKTAGHGSLRAISRKNDSWPVGCMDINCGPAPVSSTTITQLLDDAEFMELNEECAIRIDGNIDILKLETGLADEDIIRIPSLFNSKLCETDYHGSVFKEARAFFPAVINNLVLTGYNTCVAPKPWGPVVERKDIFAEEIKNTYAKVGMKIKFIDDWNSHHRHGGGVHCGTNSLRDMSAKWWLQDQTDL